MLSHLEWAKEIRGQIRGKVPGERATTIVNVVAATNINSEEGIKKGIFREDLYYRLKVVQIQTLILRRFRPIHLPQNHRLHERQGVIGLIYIKMDSR